MRKVVPGRDCLNDHRDSSTAAVFQFSICNLQFAICNSFLPPRRRSLLTMSAIHWDSFFFLFFALVTCVFAVAVVVSSNIVRMAAYLVASLCGVAGLFFLAGAEFLGAMQLMLYVGGTVVLLVFGVMLTARGPFVSMQSGGGQWILALLAGGSLLAVLLQTVGQVRPIAEPTPAVDHEYVPKPRRPSVQVPDHNDPIGRRAGRRPHRQARSASNGAEETGRLRRLPAAVRNHFRPSPGRARGSRIPGAGQAPRGQ